MVVVDLSTLKCHPPPATSVVTTPNVPCLLGGSCWGKGFKGGYSHLWWPLQVWTGYSVSLNTTSLCVPTLGNIHVPSTECLAWTHSVLLFYYLVFPLTEPPKSESFHIGFTYLSSCILYTLLMLYPSFPSLPPFFPGSLHWGFLLYRSTN